LARSKLTKLTKKHNISTKEGDAIHGEIIAYRTRYVSKPKTVTGTSRHRIQAGKLSGGAYAFIDRAFRDLR